MVDQATKKFASAEQKLRLVSLVEADPQLRCGKFSSSFSKAEGKRRWQAISEELNSITGAKKTWEEWRKTWQDRKANAKKKFAALRRQSSITGGGPPPECPTLEETLILNTFDQQSLVGHIDSQESMATLIDLSQPETSVEEERLEIDLPPPEGFSDVTNIRGSSNKENSAPKLPGTKKKRTVAQRRLQQGLKAAETLNEVLREKLDAKKSFYTDFIKLHTEYVKTISLQTQALVDIAAAINRNCSCNVLQNSLT